MSFRSSWDSYPDDPAGHIGGENVVVSTAAETDQLVERLRSPRAGTAKVWGPDIRQDVWTGQLLHVGVHGSFAYISYTSDSVGVVFADGDPESPEYDSPDEEFPPGSGLPVGVVAAGLKEFLVSGTQPRAIPWAAAAGEL
ncbi:Imm1 family immunity protein [Amycolatopsis sp. NPDC059027]|uniref:Imm1 family immunity protein n=1 Tax=Amycolatopsis sp. NPDC059027 TaxID=3346709 RepID=UPI0036702ADD